MFRYVVLVLVVVEVYYINIYGKKVLYGVGVEVFQKIMVVEKRCILQSCIDWKRCCSEEVLIFCVDWVEFDFCIIFIVFNFLVYFCFLQVEIKGVVFCFELLVLEVLRVDFDIFKDFEIVMVVNKMLDMNEVEVFEVVIFGLFCLFKNEFLVCNQMSLMVEFQ